MPDIDVLDSYSDYLASLEIEAIGLDLLDVMLDLDPGALVWSSGQEANEQRS